MKRTSINGRKKEFSKRKKSENLISLTKYEGVDEALSHLKSIFQSSSFEKDVPPIFFQHQLYCLVDDRTLVDKEINKMRSDFKIRLFKLTSISNEYNLMFVDDYKSHVSCYFKETDHYPIVERFFEKIVTKQKDISIRKETFTQLGFSEKDILKLVELSLLSIRDVGDWWITFPYAGLFLKTFNRGRRSILSMVKKTKHKEMLLNELEKRPFPRIASLGFMYHLYDIIGADMVECVPTTTSILLRLR